MSDSGAVWLLASPFCCHCDFIDSESLPTGIAMPSAGASSAPTAFTVSNRRASSSPCPQAAIQLAERRTSLSFAIEVAAMLVMASPTAMRPEAGASSSASTGRSPMLIASPVMASKPVAVTAQSATGTCQGPTIWSRTVRPPTVRSPMVMRKFFDAMLGWRSTRWAASLGSMRAVSSAANCCGARVAERFMRGGLPSSTGIGMLTVSLPSSVSSRRRVRSAVAVPTTAIGQRSRAQKLLSCATDSGATAST